MKKFQPYFNKSKSFLINALIVVPVLALAYTYWPVALTEIEYRRLDPDRAWEPVDRSFGLVIPALGINERVIPGVDPFVYTEYMRALDQGVAHAEGSHLPGEDKTVYLFSHSSDNPFSITRYNTAFYLLPRLEEGERIYIYYQDEEFVYQVVNQEVVGPDAVEYLTQLDSNQLILQTCTPIGTSINRLLVFAEPVT